MLIRSFSLRQTVERLRAGELDLPQHVEAVIDWVEMVEGQVQALVPGSCLRERLLREAAELDECCADERPALFGGLVGVKDIFRVDGFTTRAGAQLPPELFAGDQAECVAALRRAGALVLGKTVTAEFAYFEPGPTRNPHDLAHTPGGSSSGSAAAVAAGYCSLALGTQTVGSVIRPAAFCGVVGFKPSFERISTEGLIFFSPSADTVGMFTQDVTSMRLAAELLCRDWKGEAAVEGPVLGIPEGPYLEQASTQGLTGFAAQVRLLEEKGFQVKRVAALNDIAEINRRHRSLIAGEAGRVHAVWFGEYEELYRPRMAEIVREGQKVGEDDLERARTGRGELREVLEKLMRSNGIDVWICPSAMGTAPLGLQSTGDPVMNLPWTHAGLPALSLPAGRAENGLPLGLQCVAGFGRDEELLAWGERLAGELAGEREEIG